MVVSLPQLIVKNLGVDLERGRKYGLCVFCGLWTEEGFEIDFPQTFISFDRVHEGNVICPYCYYVFKHPEFRRKSWLVTENSFRFLDTKDKILNIILRPPREPWMLYVTRSRRKHGWLNLVEKLNYCDDVFVVGFDETILVIVKKEFERLHRIVVELRKAKVPKREILSCNFSVGSIRKVKDINLLRELKAWSFSPQLDLLLYLVR